MRIALLCLALTACGSKTPVTPTPPPAPAATADAGVEPQPPADAAPPDAGNAAGKSEHEKALDEVRIARTAYDLGKFQEAIEHYEAAYEHEPDAVYLFDIAQAYRFMNDCKKAYFFYKRYLALADAKGSLPAKTRTEIQGHLADLEECIKKQEASPPVPD
jgi:tetratricopeptide (TPR) repeat protein